MKIDWLRVLQIAMAILVLSGIIYPILARLGFLPILFPSVFPEFHL
jgi:hypothetical protein